MIRIKELAPVTKPRPVTKGTVTKGRPRIYVTAAERQRAYRARKKATGGGTS